MRKTDKNFMSPGVAENLDRTENRDATEILKFVLFNSCAEKEIIFHRMQFHYFFYTIIQVAYIYDHYE